MTPLDLIAKHFPSVPKQLQARVEAVEWIEDRAYIWCTGTKCEPKTLIRGWNGSGYEVRHCARCGQSGTSA